MCAPNLTLANKLTAAVGKFVPRLLSRQAEPGRHRGDPVHLRHRRRAQRRGAEPSRTSLANVAQVRAHIDLYATDVLFNPLPVFHCFGLTVGTILPLIAGMKVVCHPTPLQPREIVRRIQRHGATILLSTDTFINQYARAGEAGDLDCLRLAVCGAERLRDETRACSGANMTMDIAGRLWRHRSLAGRGRQPDRGQPSRHGGPADGGHGSHGSMPVEGIPGAGELHVQRPQCHAGLYQSRRAGHRSCRRKTAGTTPAMWSASTNDGFIAIRGRLKRFAKIGGETVSLAVVENIAAALWPDNAPCRGGDARRDQGRTDRAGDGCGGSAPPGPDRLGAESWRFRAQPFRAGCWSWIPISPARHRQDRLCLGAENCSSKTAAG